MKPVIMHIVGNRPQFIKLAPISKELRKRDYQEVIIHTGQHFDDNMSDVFFDELGILMPDENLHVSGGSHAEMTARIMLALESVVVKYNPGIVFLYGDTNSTLAAAVVVRKLNIPIVHIEAGLRTGVYENPEEVNRIFTDHASSILCAPDKRSLANLEQEGLGAKSYFTGDVMYDAYCYYRNRAGADGILKKYGIQSKEYILMTWHRQENTSEADRMRQILGMVEAVGRSVVCPMHPRTYKKLAEYDLLDYAMNIDSFKIIEPVGYLEMISLSSNSRMIITDSGGLSKESYFAGVKCFYMLDISVWSDLDNMGWIRKMTDDDQRNIRIVNELCDVQQADKRQEGLFYGDGHAAEKIIDLVETNVMR